MEPSLKEKFLRGVPYPNCTKAKFIKPMSIRASIHTAQKKNRNAKTSPEEKQQSCINSKRSRKEEHEGVEAAVRSSNGPKIEELNTAAVGSDANEFITVTLSDPKVLACYVCFKPLSIPASQVPSS